MKALAILGICLVSTFSQVNLKLTSDRIPVNWTQLSALGFLGFCALALRVLPLAGISLFLTWFSYRRFQFIELYAALSLSYVFAIAVGYFIFQEELNPMRMGSIGLILSGIFLFYQGK